MVARAPTTTSAFRKVKKGKPKYKVVPTKALTSAIKKIQMKNQETKIKQVNLIQNQGILGNGLDYDFNTDSYNGGGGHANVLSSAARMSTGTEDFKRIGNEIQPVSMTLKGFIRCMPYDGNVNSNRTPFDVYMVVYKKKDEPEGSTDQLSTYHDGTKGKIDGSIITTILNPFNRDNYVIKKLLKFRMKPQPFINENAVANPPTHMPTIENPSTSSTSTRDFFRTFKVNVPIKKTLRYNSAAESAPVNEWFGIGFYYINGDATATTASAANQIRCQATVQTILKYKDA